MRFVWFVGFVGVWRVVVLLVVCLALCMLWFVLFVCCFGAWFDCISVLLGVQMGLLCSAGCGSVRFLGGG